MAYNMDSDRRSAVSSFYGGRKSSLDALNDPSAFQGGDRPRADSSTSFYGNTNRNSHNVDGYTPTAGYNRTSYFDAGREAPVKGFHDEEDLRPRAPSQSWDVFADFNNTGPRYSAAFGQGNAAAYQPIPVSSSKNEDDQSTLGPVELVTVPALGPEWKASELRDMTKAGQKEKKAEQRQRKWRQFTRDQRGLFGNKWFTRKVLVFTVFGICVVAGIVLAFTIPRVPGVQQLVPPLLNSSEPPAPQFPRSPTNFSFNANAALQIDTSSNFLPLAFKGITATVYDAFTQAQIATGSHGPVTLPAKQFSNLQLPLNFTYVAANASDLTWLSWYDACRNSDLNINGTRPTVAYNLVVEMNIAGLIGSHGTSLQVTNVACPFELPKDAP